jgi:kynurenine/2-aminoadipate aminotransferase
MLLSSVTRSVASHTRSVARPLPTRVMSASLASKSSSPRGSTKALDPNLFITQLNSRRQPSAIRSLQPLMAIPGMISLGGGLPNPALFPFKGLTMDLVDGSQLSFTPTELNEALQYSPTPGLPKFVAQLKAMMVREHKPQMDESTWTVSVATGSSDAIFKAFDMLVEAGDNVLIEAPTFSGTLSSLRPLMPNFLEIEVSATLPHAGLYNSGDRLLTHVVVDFSFLSGG